MRPEVWNLRTHRCFRALKRAFAAGCARFGFRLIHFSVQGNHIHFIVEAPDQESLTRAMKGLAVRMARKLNRMMRRRGQVFPDRYHAHRLLSQTEAARAVRYVLDNWSIHAVREGRPPTSGIDPYCSAMPNACGPPLVRPPQWSLLRVGILRRAA